MREFVIFTLLTLMLMGLGYLVGLFIGSPEVLTLFALIVASLMNLLAYFYGDSLVLKMTNAKLIDKSKAPRLYRIVEKVSQKMNLPTPKIGIVPTLSPNAFATGRDPQHSIVCVTEGALRLLDDEELEGVIGHELSHIKHRDTLIA
ncbi:protease, partial [archaeon]